MIKSKLNKWVVRGLCITGIFISTFGLYATLYGNLEYPLAHWVDILTLPLQIGCVSLCLLLLIRFGTDIRKRYEPYISGIYKHEFFENPFLASFGDTWKEQYLPLEEQHGRYLYQAFWAKDGKIAVMVRKSGEDELCFCDSFHPKEALALIEALNAGEILADQQIHMPIENLEPIYAIR